MFPASSFLSPGSQVPRPVLPPQGFRELDEILSVEFSISETFERQRGNSVAKENGLRYEAQAHAHLKSVIGHGYLALTLSVKTKSGHRRLVPDGVYFRPGLITIFEIKSQHMPEAWWQLRKLYQPALEFKFRDVRPARAVNVVEVCRSFDPAMPFPERPLLIADLKAFCSRQDSRFGVYQWKA